MNANQILWILSVSLAILFLYFTLVFFAFAVDGKLVMDFTPEYFNLTCTEFQRYCP